MPEFDIRRYTDLADLNPESITVGPIDDGRAAFMDPLCGPVARELECLQRSSPRSTVKPPLARAQASSSGAPLA